MSRGVRELQAQVAVLERHATATVESLHHIRARTSRVITATNAFAQLQAQARELSRAVRTFSHVNDASIDRAHVESELGRLRGAMHDLQQRFSSELSTAAKLELPVPSSRPKPWWRFWN